MFGRATQVATPVVSVADRCDREALRMKPIHSPGGAT
jgi:hypothetical protein